MEAALREEMMKRLDVFIGHWKIEVIHPHIQPNPISGYTRFEWMLENYVVQHTHINRMEFPDYVIIYDWNSDTALYSMHYFDTRGITRLYQMSLENGTWKWWRDKADFSPLKFFQRFHGEFDETGKVIRSVLEKSDDGVEWEHDFGILYRKE